MKYMSFEVLQDLLEKYKCLKCIWNLGYKELRLCDFLNAQQIQELICSEYRKNLDGYYTYMKEQRIEMVTCFDLEYPDKLRLIKNRPIVLFYRGNIGLINEKSVAIVGSRACTPYGRKCAELFASKIVERNINVVSGLAVGIDAVAHISTLNCGGKTIAVIR